MAARLPPKLSEVHERRDRQQPPPIQQPLPQLLLRRAREPEGGLPVPRLETGVRTTAEAAGSTVGESRG
ncbi:hypothetical protein GOBAR_DD17970 [Gossypium barbadense]|nr:hypothetical protein GOBAR_DD17970 [Gossypium barbadense]